MSGFLGIEPSEVFENIGNLFTKKAVKVGGICQTCNCIKYKLTKPMIVAVATDQYIAKSNPKSYTEDPELLRLLYGEEIKSLFACYPKSYTFEYGGDYEFSTNGVLPTGNPSVSSDEQKLKNKMKKLSAEFASNDTTGVAKNLINEFLKKKKKIEYFQDARLNEKARNHENIKYFMRASVHRENGKKGIHQALKDANWDINKLVRITDLGVPAFNKGSGFWRTEDWGNGLKIMINGVQHVVVVATKYYYDSCLNNYHITLRFFFYDVFGLDTDDVVEYGADGGIDTDAPQGITAWWQLQHQHGYAPLITKITIEKELVVSAK